VVGGVHGDEPEGPGRRAAARRAIEPEDVTGRLIVVPCAVARGVARVHAALAVGREPQPVVPGLARRAAHAQLADFFSRVLFPRVEVVVDMHSGGRSGLCPPWSEMHPVEDPRAARAMAEAMLAWGTDHHFVYIDIAGTGLLVGEAERQGKVVVSTELGGGGHVTCGDAPDRAVGPRERAAARRVLRGEVTTRDVPGIIGRATDDENYLLAPESGLWETFVDLGERVAAGQPVGQIHFLERPDREPAVVRAENDGIVFVVRAIATTDRATTSP
jgi:predicted deacylase